ncbi:shikimate kinase [Marinobacteraceae bacterium S3BR75-40.1]
MPSTLPQTITLLGMPGAGKSTVGQMLAESLQLPFVDGDSLIEKQTGKSLQQLIDEEGMDTFLAAEETMLTGLKGPGVLAPGGSAVLSENGLRHLRSLGPLVYLYIPVETMLARINNESSRGLARGENQGLETLYDFREPQYHKVADITVNADVSDPRETVRAIIEALQGIT